MYLTCFLITIFFANIILGAVWSYTFLSDVMEMLLLLSAAISFAIMLLKEESRTNNK